jgi:hypothetical protein
MFKVFGDHYYIDLDVIEDYTKIVHNEGTTGETENHIHIVKYETIKYLLECVLSENENIDEKMGMASSEATIPFKISFNTLLFKKIINKL